MIILFLLLLGYNFFHFGIGLDFLNGNVFTEFFKLDLWYVFLIDIVLHERGVVYLGYLLGYDLVDVEGVHFGLKGLGFSISISFKLTQILYLSQLLLNPEQIFLSLILFYFG